MHTNAMHDSIQTYSLANPHHIRLSFENAGLIARHSGEPRTVSAVEASKSSVGNREGTCHPLPCMPLVKPHIGGRDNNCGEGTPLGHKQILFVWQGILTFQSIPAVSSSPPFAPWTPRGTIMWYDHLLAAQRTAHRGDAPPGCRAERIVIKMRLPPRGISS